MSSFLRFSLLFFCLLLMIVISCAHLWLSVPSNESSLFLFDIKHSVSGILNIIMNNRWFALFVFSFFVVAMINIIFYCLSVLNRKSLFSSFVPIFVFLSFSGCHIYFYENFDLALGYLCLFLAIFFYFYFHYRLRSYDWAYILATIFLLLSYFSLGIVVLWVFIAVIFLMRVNGIRIVFRLSSVIGGIVFFFVVYHTNISSFDWGELSYYKYVDSNFLTGSFYLLPSILFIFPVFCQKYRDYEKGRKMFSFFRSLLFFLLVLSVFFNINRQVWFLSFLPCVILMSFYFRIFQRRNILQINKFFNYITVVLLLYFVFYRSESWEVAEIISIAICSLILCFYNQMRFVFAKIFLIYLALNLFILQDRYLKYEFFQRDLKNFNFFVEDKQVYTDKNIFLLNLLFFSSKKITWRKDIDENNLGDTVVVVSELDGVPRKVHSEPLYYAWEKKSLLLETYNKEVYLWFGKRK